MKLLPALNMLFIYGDLVSANVEIKGPTVEIEQGVLIGLRTTSVRNIIFLAFLGIPYAKPPVENLRFKAPQPPEPWSGIYDATEERNTCPQQDMLSGKFTGDEDCLYLNVYTNDLPRAPGDLKSVMVWIHGGCFKGGSGSSIVYGPDHLLTEDVIVVSINYRLGMLGFLSLSEVGVPGNNGMKDQVMALRWVEKNIGKFGGDPNRVTIFGESAGGASVHYHILSPMSKGLFHRVIAHSGSVLDPWAYGEPDYLRHKAFAVGERMNCSTITAKELLSCLQESTAEDIILKTIGETFGTTKTLVPLRPTREDVKVAQEDVFLPGKPEDLLSSGKFYAVPFITGVNSREAIIYTEDVQSIPTFWDGPKKHLRNVIADLLNMEDIEQANELTEMAISYYAEEEPSSRKAAELTDMFSDVGFVLGADRAVKIQAQLSTSPVYFYLFSFDGGLGLSKIVFHTEMEGVSHGDELGYVFHTAISPSFPDDSDEMRTLLRMVKMWTNFAKTGDPTSEMNDLLNVKWKQFSKTDHAYLEIGKDLNMKRDLFKERLQFWEDMLGPFKKPAEKVP